MIFVPYFYAMTGSGRPVSVVKQKIVFLELAEWFSFKEISTL